MKFKKNQGMPGQGWILQVRCQRQNSQKGPQTKLLRGLFGKTNCTTCFRAY